MSKKNDLKRKRQLESKSRFESLCFQVDFEKKKKGIGNEFDQIINEELDAIQKMDLVSDLLSMSTLTKGIKNVLNISDEADKNSFNGSYVAYLLGITDTQPINTDFKSPFIGSFDESQRYFQARVYYDNDVRNKVVNWIKSKNYTLSTRLGQPILKLSKMVIEISRVLKE